MYCVGEENRLMKLSAIKKKNTEQGIGNECGERSGCRKISFIRNKG